MFNFNIFQTFLLISSQKPVENVFFKLLETYDYERPSEDEKKNILDGTSYFVLQHLFCGVSTILQFAYVTLCHHVVDA